MLSMSGCFIFRRALNVKSTTAAVSFEEVSEDLMKEVSVTEWSGMVPEGMEVKYVVVKKVYSDGSNRDVDIFDYDKAGRISYHNRENSAYHDEWKVFYNDDGTIARREHKSIKATGSAPAYPDYFADYNYNEKKQLVSYTVNMSGKGETTYKFEYKEGHLVHADDNSGGKSYTYSLEPDYYDYCAVVSDDIDATPEVKIYKRTYSDDSFDRILTEQYEYDEYETQYVYNGMILEGWYHVNQWGYKTKYDAKGNMTEEQGPDGSIIEKWDYNERGDETLHERYDEGKLKEKTKTTYDYDTAGNKLTETSDWWTETDGEEYKFISKTTYKYGDHGLLISEVVEIGGRFTNMTVYAYKAIVVPAE